MRNIMKDNEEYSSRLMECKKKRRAGFTMVELLIAMMMTLIIVSSVGQFMALTSSTYQSIDNQVNLQVEAQCTINMIADMILEGNNVIFNSSKKTLHIYKNAGALDGHGSLVTKQTAEQNIIWFDKKSSNMYLFICKNGTDYSDAMGAVNAGDYTKGNGKLMAEGVDGFEAVPVISSTDISKGLSGGRDVTQKDGVTITVKLKTRRMVGRDGEFTFTAEDTISPRNEIVGF